MLLNKNYNYFHGICANILLYLFLFELKILYTKKILEQKKYLNKKKKITPS